MNLSQRQMMRLMNKKMILLIILFLLLCALCLIWLQDYTAVDLNIADYYFDRNSGTFPYKNSWFAKAFMHTFVKNCIIAGGVFLIAVVLADSIFKFLRIGQLLRFRLRFVALASVLIPLAISSLKHFSTLHCPWDIQRYGGETPYFKLFDSVPAQWQGGQCFPAGHASTGLWLAAFCIFWLPNAPKKALFNFLLGLSIGFAMGWVQQMRGAHFLSHTLWSLWIASAIILCMLLVSNILIKIKLD